MPGLSALKKLAESPDPRKRKVAFKLLERLGPKFLGTNTSRGGQPMDRALDSLVQKGATSRIHQGYTGIPRLAPESQEFSAMRLGTKGAPYDEAYTHYRPGGSQHVRLPKRDYKRLDAFNAEGDPNQFGFFAHSHPGGGPASSLDPVTRSGDAGAFSAWPNVHEGVVETPRPVEPILKQGPKSFKVFDPFPKGGGSRNFRSEAEADEFRRSYGGGEEVPENWMGTLDEYSFGPIKPGAGYDDIGPSAVRRATAAPYADSEANLNAVARKAVEKLQEVFPEKTYEELSHEVMRAIMAKQAQNYPDNLDYIYHATNPNDFEKVQKVLKSTGGRALDRLKLPE